MLLLYPDLSALQADDRAEQGVGTGGLRAKGAAKPGFVVRVLPGCSRHIMAPARLVPNRNNVRSRWVGCSAGMHWVYTAGRCGVWHPESARCANISWDVFEVW